MKLTADRDGNVRYFSAKLGLKEKFDPKEIEMLSAGAVPMLIPPAAVQGRRNNVIRYDISAYSTLDFHLSCILSREQFAELMLQCIEIFRRMKKVYLNYKNLVFDLDKVYVRLSNRTIHFIYLPVMSSKREASIPDFFRAMIKHSSKSTYEQSVFLDECTAWLNRPTSFILDQFECYIKSRVQPDSAPVQSVQPIHIVTPEPVPVIVRADPAPVPVPERIYKPAPKECPTASVNPEPEEEEQGGTSLLTPSEGGTVLLGEPEPSAPEVRFYLIRKQTEEKIEITGFPFLVGSEMGSASYCITGNAAVSRRHAEFSTKDGSCFITDKKSTNKSYVNNRALLPDTPQELNDGDQIRLANESFTFVREEKN